MTNDPVNGIDPSGEAEPVTLGTLVCVAVVGAAVGAAQDAGTQVLINMSDPGKNTWDIDWSSVGVSASLSAGASVAGFGIAEQAAKFAKAYRLFKNSSRNLAARAAAKLLGKNRSMSDIAKLTAMRSKALKEMLLSSTRAIYFTVVEAYIKVTQTYYETKAESSEKSESNGLPESSGGAGGVCNADTSGNESKNCAK